MAESPGVAVGWLLFVGSSVHVASTGWLFTSKELRVHARRHRLRYVGVPLVLVGGAGLAAFLISQKRMNDLLLLYFGWQFWHYHRQNYGLAALAAASQRVQRLTTMERRALVVTGASGVLAVISRPALLERTSSVPLRAAFPIAAGLFVLGSAGGIAALVGRPRAERPAVLCAGYLLALLFFAPVFIFDSPYAAVGSLVIVHGLEYLVLTGLVSTGDRYGPRRLRAATILLALGVAAGAVLSAASHMHTSGGFGRSVYGAYLGVVMTHFVIDAGVWRLRDPARKAFIASRVPFLFPAPPADISETDIRSAA